MKKEIFVDDWEERLELQFFSDNPVRKKAYVCSPLSADAEQDYLFNMYAARAYMLYALMELDYLARAPHGYLPIILCDRNSDERTLALQFGLKLMEYSDVVLVCGNKLSRGMIGEIVQAVALNKKIIVFDEPTSSLTEKEVSHLFAIIENLRLIYHIRRWRTPDRSANTERR